MRRSRNKYYECPYCHDHLDYGEPCTCRDEAIKNKENHARMYAWDDNGQLTIKQAAGA